MHVVASAALDLWGGIGTTVSKLANAAGPIYSRYHRIEYGDPVDGLLIADAKREAQAVIDAANEIIACAQAVIDAADAKPSPAWVQVSDLPAKAVAAGSDVQRLVPRMPASASTAAAG